MDSSGSEILAILAEVRERIEIIRRRTTSIGEQNTKSILISPLLSALGWNIVDFFEVKQEYRHKPQDNPVDYALFILRSPSLFIEAKDLGADLTDRRWVSQMLGYATVVGVEWCVLTNGDEYRLYNAHAPVDVDDKLFRAVRISDSADAAYTAATLSLLSKDKMSEKLIDALWKAHFVDRKVKQCLAELLSGSAPSLVRWLHSQRPELSRSEIVESLKRADIQISFPEVMTAKAPALATPGRPALITDTAPSASPGEREREIISVSLRDLIDAKIIVPPLELESTYRKRRLVATIGPDGSVIYAGRSYSSLSTAASMARQSIIGPRANGKPPSTNGWTFWLFRDPLSGQLQEIATLRKRLEVDHSK
jgi:hypothetical protein